MIDHPEVNAGILGTVGYFSYANWDRPTWDRRIVSAVSVGLLTLWTGEGYVPSFVLPIAMLTVLPASSLNVTGQSTTKGCT